jgi:hypothetical protein
MTKKPPKEIVSAVRLDLWARADDLGWRHLSDADRSRYYEQWTREKAVGGLFAEFMDPRAVRVYLKDTIMKPYLRERMVGLIRDVLAAIDIQETEVARTYIKPHGREFLSGRVVCWGNSRDWKAIMMATFERFSIAGRRERPVVVLFESGHTTDAIVRDLVREIGERLEFEVVKWLN